MPTWLAIQWVEATAPKVPAISGRVVNIGSRSSGAEPGNWLRAPERPRQFGAAAPRPRSRSCNPVRVLLGLQVRGPGRAQEAWEAVRGRMAVFTFTSVAGTRIAFDPARDQLAFSSGFSAAGLSLSVSGADLLVSQAGLWVLLGGCASATLGDAAFVFADGSVARFDAAGAQFLAGGTGDDRLSVVQGGADSADGGAGDDRIVAGTALDAADRLDGGAGTGDTLVLAGPLDVTLGPATVTGIERILVGSGGAVRLVLDDAAAASATPAPGAVFTVDATGQRQAGDALVLDGGAVAGTALALLGGAGADTLAGGGGADRLEGGAGNDSLSGGAGADTLAGGGGADRLRGGAGADLFLVLEPGAAQSAPAAPDLILDFEGAATAGGDLIALPAAMRLGRALAFSLGPVAFDFGGYGGPPQLPEPLIGDGFADLVWRHDPTDATAPFRIWLDADDDGRIGPNDVLLRLAPAAGEAPVALCAADFLAEIAGWHGTPGADSLATGGLDDSAWGEGGNDTLAGGLGADQLWGGAGDDSLLGGEHGDILRGGTGSDTLQGGEGFDTLYAEDDDPWLRDAPEQGNLLDGGAGDDLLVGGGGLDTLRGGDGNDTLFGGGGTTVLDGGAGDDLLYDLGGNDTFAGGAGHDRINGGPGDDRIAGGDGNDTLAGGPGSDTLAGGLGADRFLIEVQLAGAPASSGQAPDLLEDFTPAQGDRIAFDSPDGFVMTPEGPMPLLWCGAAFPGPPLDATGSAAPPLGFVLPGKDVGNGHVQVFWLPVAENGVAAGGWLVADLDRDSLLGAQDMVARIRGTSVLSQSGFLPGTFLASAGGPGNDNLAGGAGADQIFGLLGNDTLAGGGGNDRLEGGAGSDFLLGGAGADQLWGGTGADTLRGGEGEDELFAEGDENGESDAATDRNLLLGEGGDDRLYGGGGADTLRGGLGRDLLYGGEGADRLEGEAGDDTLLGGGGADTLYGLGDADLLEGGAGADLLVGGDGADRLAGGAEADRLFGEAGADTLLGGEGNDWLSGGDGADELAGEAGDDTLAGGAGDDLYRLDATRDRVVEAAGGGADTIVLEAGEGCSLPAEVEALVLGAGSYGVGNALANLLVGNDAANRLVGHGGDDTLLGGGGADTLYGLGDADLLEGGAGADLLVGGDGADRLAGGAEADRLFGEAGADTLLGGEGNDRLNGGEGRDTFLIARGGGTDTITDFLPGGDQIELRGTAIQSFEALLAASQQVGANLAVALGGGEALVLLNVQKSALLPADFLFAP
ncbi:hypothetical protein K1J50_01040 [Caldovatus sp. SYSU G05006]|uniref:Calcium-binding protein n=2 Tax=Caldovatus aquaticus TaxID=2865671 RepID=A0ABS7EXJ0_9PROT|nr:hypothetical protein [Caldovatus aquaticus]